MKQITLNLTTREALILRELLDGEMRDKQGDGSLDDEADDALVELNDKIDLALEVLGL